MDLTAECHVRLYEQEVQAICNALNAHEFHDFNLTVETRRGKFQPVLSVTGDYREARDLDWAIENLLKVLDTIGWTVRKVQADPKVAEIDFYLNPGSHPDFLNTRDTARNISGVKQQ